MTELIEKVFSIPNLPTGTGSALGACLRALYLTASRKLSIIGIQISREYGGAQEFTVFSPLSDSGTALVNDLILHLTTEPYFIDEEHLRNYDQVPLQNSEYATENGHEIMKGLYKIQIPVATAPNNEGNMIEISKSNFSSAFTPVCDYHGYSFPNRMVALNSGAKPLIITLYVSDCCGNYTQADSAAHLDKYDIEGVCIPVAGCGQRTSKCWFTISDSDASVSETLTMHIAGDAPCIHADIQNLKEICKHYLQICNTHLDTLS